MTRMPAALRRQVLTRVEPSPALTRRARAATRRLIAKAKALAKERGLDVRPQLVGSLAKATHLATPLDLDVFLLFDPSTTRDALQKEGLALGHALVPGAVERYAEHPYVHGVVEGFDVDVVPAYRLRNARGKLSAVDRTPFHTRWVGRHATPKLRAEIRLFKQWLRGVGGYGAETATGGVSGYLAELLVLHHGSFPKTLDALATWKPGVEIILEGRPASLGGGPLVVIDPVDATRNAAAAVTPATFERLQRAARAFRRKPTLAFFFPGTPQAWPEKRLRKALDGSPTIAWCVPPAGGKDGTDLPQAQRLLAKVARGFATAGFTVERSHAHVLGDGHVLLLVHYDPPQLPGTHVHEGPRDEDAQHRDRFLAKWRNHPDALGAPKLQQGRWRVEVKRNRRTPDDVFGPRLAEFLQGFAFASEAADRTRWVSGAALAKREEWALALTLFLGRVDPWQAPAKES